MELFWKHVVNQEWKTSNQQPFVERPFEALRNQQPNFRNIYAHVNALMFGRLLGSISATNNHVLEDFWKHLTNHQQFVGRLGFGSI